MTKEESKALNHLANQHDNKYDMRGSLIRPKDSFIAGYNQAIIDRTKHGEVPKDRDVIRWYTDGVATTVRSVGFMEGRWWSDGKIYLESAYIPNVYQELPQAPEIGKEGGQP